jgi:hypothetical protein
MKRKSKKTKKSKIDNTNALNLSSNDDKFIFSETDENGKYPNELARISMSISEGAINDILITNECDTLLNSNSHSNISDDDKNLIMDNADKYDVSVTPGTEGIWKNLALGKIDLSYAEVGYTMNGRQILDHDLLTTLLTTYGFHIDDTLHFIDDLVINSEGDDSSPIIMINKSVSDMMDKINPLEKI